MKKNKIKVGALALMSSGFLISCGGEETPVVDPLANNGQDVVVDAEDLEVDLASFGVMEDIQYTVPTPNEFIESVSMLEQTPDFGMLNSIENASDYSDKRTKALNFGVYSADLTFASNFKAPSDITIKYFGVVNTLATELDMATAIDVAVKDKMEQFLSTGMNDSVRTIGDQTYFKAYQYLEDNGRGDALSMVVAGGWIEGLYLMTSLVTDYDKDADLVDAIASQSFTVESVMGFLNKYKANEDVARIMKDIEPVANILANVEIIEVEGGEAFEDENGVLVIPSSTAFTLMPEQFEELKKEVAALRESITM